MNQNNKNLTISLNYQTLFMVLFGLYVVTVVLMLYLWQPWNTVSADTRKITVSGEATLEAEPDEYQFNPSYSVSGENKEATLELAAEKSNEVVDGLKSLGIEEKDIKVEGSSHDWYWSADENDKDYAYVYMTVTVNDKDMAQKVQDYLLTTKPEGQITPFATFSEDKQNELEDQARVEAVADAKINAQASADELEVKLGKVISVDDGQSFGGYPIAYAENGLDAVADSNETVSSSIPVQPGENEYYYSVTVVYEIK